MNDAGPDSSGSHLSTASTVFTKTYGSVADLDQAVGNYYWLASLSPPARLPVIVEARGATLVLERVAGRPVRPDDLTAVAAHLGSLHAAAHRRWLHRADLARDLDVSTKTRPHRIPGFLVGRAQAVEAALRSGRVPDPLFGPSRAAAYLARAVQGPVAFYKDANPRNFLVPDSANDLAAQPWLVDFDSMSLSPPGYDLAKLMVGLAMTHGRLRDRLVLDGRDAYNAAAEPALPPVTAEDLLVWAEVHHVLTHRYLGQHGYRHSWHEVRPLPAVTQSLRECSGSARSVTLPFQPTQPRLRDQLDAPDELGRDLELYRARCSRFSDDPRLYVFSEALVDHFLRGRSPTLRTAAHVRASLAAIRSLGMPLDLDEGLVADEGIDLAAELDARELWRYRLHLDGPSPDAVVVVVGAPRSGTSHLTNLLARTLGFAHFTTASCWAWPTRNLADPHRATLGGASAQEADAIFAADNRRTRVIPALVMPGEAEDAHARAIPTYRHLGGHRYDVTEPTLGQLDVLTGGVSAHLTHFGSTAFLTKSPFHSFRIPLLERLWGPRANYIHIVRDRDAVGESMRRNGFAYSFDGEPAAPEVARDRFVQAVEQTAPADRTLTVAHADLTADPQPVIRRISEWLDL